MTTLSSTERGEADTLARYPAGYRFRTARKAHRCANASRAERGVEWAQVCRRSIRVSERYLQGEMDPGNAGGFGFLRYCAACAEGGLA